MKVLHSGSLDIKSGGPALSTYLTIKGLKEYGIDADLIMPPLSKDGKLIASDVSVHYTNPVALKRFGYMHNIRPTLSALGKYDLYHIQGLWQYLGHSVASFALRNHLPYIITLRGMLYPQALSHSAIIKRLSLKLYQGFDLKHAVCIQATCDEELNFYRELGFKNPVAVIPNPIETDGIINRKIISHNNFRIGYLGRIHPRKRIERLIYAFNSLRSYLKDWELLIIGSGDVKYEEFLHAEVERLELKNVTFTGFLSGREKDDAIMSLAYLIVPSDFENFGNIVTEALVRGIPVVASKGTPWQDLEKYHCGWWIDNDQETINDLIKSITNITIDSRRIMGKNAKELVKEKYSVNTLGKKMASLYKWLLNYERQPDFIDF